MSEIDIKGLDKAEVLCALYKRARVQGMGYLHARDGDMPIEEARELLKQTTYFDYVHGRVMKVSLRDDVLQTGLYDRSGVIFVMTSPVEEKEKTELRMIARWQLDSALEMRLESLKVRGETP